MSGVQTMATPRRANERTRGMSTMEVLAGATLSLAILGIAMSFFTAQQRALRVQSTFTESQNVTRTFKRIRRGFNTLCGWSSVGPNAVFT